MAVTGSFTRGDNDSDKLSLKRHFVLPGLILALAEVVLVALPLYTLFGETSPQSTLWRVALPVFAGAEIAWVALLLAYLLPIQRAVSHARRGEAMPRPVADAAYRATWNMPLTALVVRTALWVAASAVAGAFWMRYAGWSARQVVELSAMAAVHAFAVSAVRAIWYQSILARARQRLFPAKPRLLRFADGYGRRMLLVVLVANGGTVAAVSAFIYYFMPVTLAQYLQLQTFFPVWVVVATCAWMAVAWRSRRRINAYLSAAGAMTGRSSGERDARAETEATPVYRLAQLLPYRFAATSLALWALAAAVVTYLANGRFRLELDDAVVIAGIILVIAVGAAIYEALWHREAMRPLIEHLTLRHRLPVRGIRTSLSLRAKLLVSFGGVVAFSCGLALFWAFMQYKNLVTSFVAKQADLGVAWLTSEIRGAAAARTEPPSALLVREVLGGVQERSPESGAIYYYIPSERGAEILAQGGGPMGAPELPWYARAQIKLPAAGRVDVDSLALSGRHARLKVSWHGQTYDLGGLAVFYPNYRGRGSSVVRPLKELVVFFLVLFGACGGIVLFTVAQFVTPIRLLEQRADGMARGELAHPVSSGGEGDEVGRLTFALEEMRRALRDKLRSTEEVNLDLERAVQRRTADLAKKNRELAEALEKLTRAQDQLVRAEKMASIGQLVAGIAHEINNPVNAIVNTVGPLEEAIVATGEGSPEVKREAVEDAREMIGVVKRGAERTKAIVQALHNYSRTDDESVVDVDLNYSLDDSLELLRHIIKGAITVERNYGEVGRVRGHAGQLNQVFMNLLTNAAQAVAGNDNATITVDTETDSDGRAVIRIRDNGPGIPAHVLPRIFDPFFTTKDVGEGTGLGLSIVHGIVERHGGLIEVDSHPGQTTFTITLPRNPHA